MEYFRRSRSALGKAALFLIAFACFLPLTMLAQDTAEIVGTVSDSTGAVIPNAKISVTNPDRGFVRDVVSNASGEYVANRVPIGNYVIIAEAGGFQKLTRSGITLTAGQIQRVDLTLTVGQVTQQIEVVGNIAKVETESATISDVVTSKQIDNLALNGQNIMALEFLIPGAAITDGQEDAMTLGHSGAEVNVSFNGNRIEYSQLEYDGGNNAQESSTSIGGAVTPAVDSIAEFRISTSNYGADVGQHAGALVEMVTKGGTKDFHGTMHEDVRNQILDANDFFSNMEIDPPGGNAPKSPLQWNVFGYTFGGPFYIPHLYNASKQKTFFFWSQEWARYRMPGANINRTAPTARMREGDFSECDPASGNYRGGDPNTPQFTPENCVLPSLTLPGSETPFVADTVQQMGDFEVRNGLDTQANLDQALKNSADYLNAYVPLPNNGATGYHGAHKTPTNFSDTLFRVDQNINDKASLFVRFASDTWVRTNVPALWQGNAYDTTASAYSVPARQWVMHLNYNVKPTLMNEFIFSYTDTPHTISPLAGPASIAKSINKPSDYQASTFFAANQGTVLLPGINVSGGGPFGFWANSGNYRGPYDAEPVYTYRDNVAWIHGKHTVKTGFFLEKFQLTEQFGTEVQGYYNFINSGPLTTNNALADMFLGRINNYQEGTFNDHGNYIGGYGVGHWRRTDFEPYIQDDWKVNRKLTLNAGVRYYLLIPPHDVTKPTVDSSFIPSLYNPQLVATLGPDGILHTDPSTGRIYDGTQFGNGLVECGKAPVAKGCQVPYKWDIGPRFGFAIDPTGSGKTSIRGGFGIYYEPGNGNDANVIGLEGNPPTTLGPTQYNILSYNFSGGSFAGVAPGNPQAIPYNQKNPAVSQFNLNVQHEFRGNNIVTVAYVGTQGRHLDSNRSLDQIPIPVVKNMTIPALSSGNGGPCDENGVCDVQDVLIHNRASTAYFVPYQGFNSINQKQFSAVSGYNAFQANYRHTTGHGLTFQAAYTWSHMIDNSTSAYNFTSVDANYDMNRWKATSDLNRQQVAMLNYVYDLPFFKNSTNKFAKQAIGGWRISGITAMFTGSPSGVGLWGMCGASGFQSGIGGGLMCNPVGKFGVSKSIYQDPEHGPILRWFNPSTLAQPTLDQYYGDGQAGMFGTLGRNTLNGPGRNNWDLAIFKEVQFPWFKGEHSTLQVRMETFNTFNHTQWQGVNVGCSGTGGVEAFGRTCGGDTYNAGNGEVAGTWSPRNIQLGMKFQF